MSMIETSVEYKEAWFFGNSGLEDDSSLQIIRIGHNIAKPGYMKGPRIQSEYSMFFIMEGMLQLKYEYSAVQLAAGDVFCLMQDNLHSYELIHSEPALRKIWIAFRGAQIGWLLRQLNLTPEKPYLREAIKPHSRFLLQALLKRMNDHTEPDQLQLIAAFYQLLAAIKPEEQQLQSTQAPHWIYSAKAYIDANYSENIALEDVCAHVKVSRGHLSEVFMQKFGKTPAQYLMSLRMERAMNLIGNTPYSITEIAQSVGYQNLFSFSRAFRNYYGFPPNSLRTPPVIHEADADTD
jgi:AraC-like DNA-binding protein